AGRAVVPEHPGQEVAILEAVVGPAEERDLADQLAPREIRDGLGGAWAVEEQRIGHVSLTLSRQVTGVEFAELVPAHDVETVDIAELPAQRQQRLQRHGGVVETRLARQ